MSSQLLSEGTVKIVYSLIKEKLGRVWVPGWRRRGPQEKQKFTSRGRSLIVGDGPRPRNLGLTTFSSISFSSEESSDKSPDPSTLLVSKGMRIQLPRHRRGKENDSHRQKNHLDQTLGSSFCPLLFFFSFGSKHYSLLDFLE